VLLTKLASIQHILWEIIEDYNIDPEPVFRRVNLDPDLLFEPGARYPLSGISALWREMETLIEDPCFGLKTADHWHPSHFGTIGYAMLASGSVRMALERLIRYHRVVSDAKFGELVEDAARNMVHVRLNWNEEEPWSAAREDAALTYILSSCRLNFRKRLDPRQVEMTHDQYQCLDRYEKFFNCRVELNRPAPVLSFSLTDVDKPLRSADEYLAQFHDRIMEDYISRLSEVRLIRSVQRVLASQLPGGLVTVDAVARQLGMSTRKLQRELKLEGTTYQELLNSTRKELAQRYVMDISNDLTEVAFILGFADLSTFSRSFKRWTGQSPSRFRKSGGDNEKAFPA
jgi:AraC-like DNA-binding protein